MTLQIIANRLLKNYEKFIYTLTRSLINKNALLRIVENEKAAKNCHITIIVAFRILFYIIQLLRSLLRLASIASFAEQRGS